MRALHGKYVDFYLYQFALGITIRWYSGRLHFRLYLGPFKFHV